MRIDINESSLSAAIVLNLDVNFNTSTHQWLEKYTHICLPIKAYHFLFNIKRKENI